MNHVHINVVIGYCMNLTIIHLVTRTTPLVFHSFYSYIGGPSTMVLFFSTGYVITFFALALRGIATNPLRFGVLTIIVISLGIGLFGLFTFFVFGLFNLTIVKVSYFCFGIGLACSFALWQQSLCSHFINKPEVLVAIGSAIAAAVLIPSFICNIEVFFGLLFVCVLIDAILLGRYCQKVNVESPLNTRTITLVGKKTVSRLFASIWKYVICIGAIGLAERIAATMVEGHSNFFFMYIAYSGSTILAVLVLLKIWKSNRLNLSFSSFYGFVVIAVALAFIPQPFFGQGYSVFVAILSNIAFTLVSMFMVISSVNIAKNRDINPTLVFGLFAGLVFLIASIGPTLLTWLETNQGIEGISRVVVGSMIVVYCLSAAGASLVMSKKHVKDNVELESDITMLSRPSQTLVGQFKRNVTLQQDLIPACCEMIKKRYDLTERQTEVLELIARGRDLNRIADTLCVSYNTARTHCRNLYGKLNVHKKQEILDILEEVRQEIDIDGSPAI